MPLSLFSPASPSPSRCLPLLRSHCCTAILPCCVSVMLRDMPTAVLAPRGLRDAGADLTGSITCGATELALRGAGIRLVPPSPTLVPSLGEMLESSRPVLRWIMRPTPSWLVKTRPPLLQVRAINPDSFRPLSSQSWALASSPEARGCSDMGALVASARGVEASASSADALSENRCRKR